MNRREVLKFGGQGAVAVAVGGPLIFVPKGCKVKDAGFYVQALMGVLIEVKPLLPGSAQLIATALKIAETFDGAYRAGKFDTATAVFTNLSELLSQIAADAGVNSAQVKIALAFAGVAIRAIAVLLKSQADQPGVMEAIRARPSAAAQRQIELIEKLADDVAIDRLFLAVKP